MFEYENKYVGKFSLFKEQLTGKVGALFDRTSKIHLGIKLSYPTPNMLEVGLLNS